MSEKTFSKCYIAVAEVPMEPISTMRKVSFKMKILYVWIIEQSLQYEEDRK
jgi:hypothetical protein